MTRLRSNQTTRSNANARQRRRPAKLPYLTRWLASLAAALVLLVGMAKAPIYREGEVPVSTFIEQELVEMNEIEQTRQEAKPPPPPRPPVPIEVANDTVLEDDVLDLDATLDIGEATEVLPPPPPPPMPEAEEEPEYVEPEIFVVVEEMPEIIGGTARVYELVEYPEIARKAGMEGLVVIQVVVEPTGEGTEHLVARSAGGALDQAALDAVRQIRFKPGKQRGTAVRVKFAVPVRFRLREAG